MRNIDRYNLIDRIGRELQSRMGYSDIDIFLKGFGVDTANKTPSTNSKWVYVKELLADANEVLVIKIADELEIAHGYTINRNIAQEDSQFWIPGYFRLFISHQSKDKVRATRLKEAFKKYAISGFVAHEDIDPTLEWQNEIEKALASMDALTAILTSGFNESSWTDQEIGYALGRGVLVVPLRSGIDPYGFIGKVQAVSCYDQSVAQVTSAVFQALSSNSATKNKLATVLVDQVVAASKVDVGFHFFRVLRQIETLAESHFVRLRDNISTNTILATHSPFVEEFNALLKEREIDLFVYIGPAEKIDDQIPF